MTSSTSEVSREPAAPVAREMRHGGGSVDACGGDGVTTAVLIEAGGARYCLDVHRVHGVVPVGAVTRVPGSRPAVLGVTNVRGRVLPLADLEAVLDGDAAAERGPSGSAGPAEGTTTAVLVGMPDEDRPTFAFLGTVLDVVELDGLEVEPPPAFGLGAAAPLVVGVVRLPSEHLALLLHPQRLLAAVGAMDLDEDGKDGDLPRGRASGGEP